jgi:FKBP-type peptidyl-prolyl cis-trans isomerase
MSMRRWVLLALLCAAAGCGNSGNSEGSEGGGTGADAAGPPAETGTAAREVAGGTPARATEIVPGLTARVLEEGSGTEVRPGDTAVVHYTGWLHDPQAAGARGAKFDSSVDRGQPFEFTIGAGQVIRGWDEGVRGMQVGEVRELTIAPHLGYGARGIGPIPPNSTLVFEVELLDIKPGAAE